MKPVKALTASHGFLRHALKEGDRALDATCGNGHDTLFLCRQVGPQGLVYAMDIQPQAIQRTRERLAKEGLLQRVSLIQGDHSQLKALIPPPLQAIAFNLGYLPRSDHEVVTKPHTTIQAVQQSLQLLSPGGLITIVAYTGHEEGKKEVSALEEYLKNLPQSKVRVLSYAFLNQKNQPPRLYVLEKSVSDHYPDPE